MKIIKTKELNNDCIIVPVLFIQITMLMITQGLSSPYSLGCVFDLLRVHSFFDFEDLNLLDPEVAVTGPA